MIKKYPDFRCRGDVEASGSNGNVIVTDVNGYAKASTNNGRMNGHGKSRWRSNIVSFGNMGFFNVIRSNSQVCT